VISSIRMRQADRIDGSHGGGSSFPGGGQGVER
jgi:hypothetical protein